MIIYILSTKKWLKIMSFKKKLLMGSLALGFFLLMSVTGVDAWQTFAADRIPLFP